MVKTRDLILHLALRLHVEEEHPKGDPYDCTEIDCKIVREYFEKLKKDV